MERNETKKFVYEDNKITKVIRGLILKEDDFTYTVQTAQGEEIVIGKRAIIRIYSDSSGGLR